MKLFISKSFVDPKLLDTDEVIRTLLSYTKVVVPIGWLSRAKNLAKEMETKASLPMDKLNLASLYLKLESAYNKRVQVLKIPIKTSMQVSRKNRTSVIYNIIAGSTGGFVAQKRRNEILVSDTDFFDIVNFLDRIPIAVTHREKHRNSDYAKLVFNNVVDPFELEIYKTGSTTVRLVFREIENQEA